MSSEPAIVIGSIVDGIVKGITRFGAFIELPDGRTGLVHISEVANTFVRDINEFLKQEDKVRVKVLSVDGKKIGLSIKQADPAYRPAFERRSERRSPRTLDDMLAKFLKDSEDKQSTLRRRMAGGKRPGGRGFGGSK